jgi:hypothetical protein
VYLSNLWVLVLPGIVCFLFLALYFSVRQRWQVAGEIREPRRYLFSEKGIEAVGETFHGSFAWSHIVGIERTRSVIGLGTAQKQYSLIPTNSFTAPQELAQFETLLQDQVPGSR